MRKLTIIFLVLITIIFAACRSQPKAKKEPESCCVTTTTTVDKQTGAKKVVTEKHYGPIPDCTEPITYTPCKGTTKARSSAQPKGTPEKLTPAQQSQSLKPGR
jgi:hypothetical protein